MKVTLYAVTVVVFVLLTVPLAAGAPPAGKVWRIGVLTGIISVESPRGVSFRQWLRKLGYVEDQNIAIECRLSGGSAERFPDLAAELDSLFTAMAREKVDAVLVHPSQMISAHRARIAALAAQSRLPTMGVVSWWSEAGGLMSYAARDIDLYQRAASYVDKILRGTQAADLPVEQPMKFELIINLQTAKTLGLTISPTLRFQADKVLQ